ncbi:HD domain-containing protein [Rhodovulum sulfidophilum]|uniref:HD domain-containing protein n=1 Tax=Rhodovulum sulfidophilum TaxID=35806 RepID=UPI001923C0DF|nr:HD domain-containing protein [Rhodovulum sulfidophilum]MBL3576183.1 HD domain-containing protein [Rhodovulum sulfidophilum]MCE8433466.1 HD domain-containing protein [Rhodovulum sulfidophilum]MCF4119011.1 HD domain-containing protein [Rhodovulum sulfidophilum]
MVHDQSADLRTEALELAQKVHSGQVDKLGNPYIEHVCAVASSVAHLGPEFEIVGLLHDSLEDCADRNLVSMDILIGLFGPDIADAVTAMSRRSRWDRPMTAVSPKAAGRPVPRIGRTAQVWTTNGRYRL